MIKNCSYWACILIVVAAVSLCAADFWQKKKYSEWTPKEVHQMLNDSPWAMQVEVNVEGVGPRGGGMREGRAGGRPPSANVDRQGRGGETGSERPPVPPKPKVLVRFHTALPVKQAVARASFGDQVLASAEAAKMLSRSEDAYLVGITGPPKLIAADPAVLKPNAFINLKGREPIRAQTVTTDKGEAGPVIYFVFPREPNPIRLEDESFELQINFPQFEIKRRFKLKDMVFDGKLEL